jgi:hypothetical protein
MEFSAETSPGSIFEEQFFIYLFSYDMQLLFSIAMNIFCVGCQYTSLYYCLIIVLFPLIQFF